MKNKFSFYLLLVSLSCIILSCEDTVDPELEQAEPVLNIDAWINNKPDDQIIKLTWSIAYDDNENLPRGIKGATVTVTDSNGKTFLFVEDTQKNNGSYVWSPSAQAENFGELGLSYMLTVTYDGETFQASSRMNEVPVIDSITYEYEDDNPFFEEGYSAEFWSRDLTGEGNTYWIRTFKNDVELNKPSEINIAYDAGISVGFGNDGKIFLPPVRQGINPDEVDENDDPLAPYDLGDNIRVEIHSITLEAFNYWSEVMDNTDRQTGIGGLFSSPLTNVSTNITNNDVTGSAVVGFFNVSSVSQKERKLY
jgi:hypothetical protein